MRLLSRHAVIEVNLPKPRSQLSSPETPMSRICCEIGEFDQASRSAGDRGLVAIPVTPGCPPSAGSDARTLKIPANGPVAVCTAPQQDSLRLEKSAISKKFRVSLGVIRDCPRMVNLSR